MHRNTQWTIHSQRGDLRGLKSTRSRRARKTLYKFVPADICLQLACVATFIRLRSTSRGLSRRRPTTSQLHATRIAQRIEQGLQSVVIDLVHQREQTADLAGRKALARKPV